MKLGIVAPISLLDKYCTLSDLQICYSTLLDNPIYSEFYSSRTKDTVILEYSPILPRRVGIRIEEFKEAVLSVKPKGVALPSVDYSCRKTVSLAVSIQSVLPKSIFIGVLQGTNLDELEWCYKELKKICEVIGLPSTNELIMKREWILRKLRIEEPVFYLEVHSNPIEEMPVDDNVIGICTSFPLRLAFEERSLSEFSPTPSLLDFEMDRTKDTGMGTTNIKKYMEILDVR